MSTRLAVVRLVFLFRFVSPCPVPSPIDILLPLFLVKTVRIPPSSSRITHASFSIYLYIGDFTMSKSFQNLLFAFLFLLGHLLSPTMSQVLLGASCPKGKVMVCCYGAPFVCYTWDWPCEDYEVEQCCKRTDVCTSLPLYK